MKRFGLLISTICFFASFGLYAAENSEQKIKENLQKIDSRIMVKKITSAPIGGLKEIELQSGEVVYSDENGEYFLLGQLYRFSDDKGFVNLTEEKAKAQRVAQISQVRAEDMITFAPKDEVKATMNIFTDVDCPYCQKLHEEVPELNKMGVQVNYLAFPRNGMNSKTFSTMVSIWCAGDTDAMRSAMTAAKTGGSVENKTCQNPVLQQFAMGQNMGVSGTPATVLDDGTLLPGYMPAARIGKMLGL